MASEIKAKAQKGSVGRTIIITLVVLGVALKVAVRVIEKREKEEYSKILQKSSERMRPLYRQLEEISEQQKEANEFTANIELHYKRLHFFYNEQEYRRASKELELFSNYQMMDYKDVADIGDKIRIAMIQELEEKVKKIPAARAGENLRIYKQLLVMDPDNQRYKDKVAFYQAKVDELKRIYQERVAKFGEVPVNNPLDGSVDCVKDYLKQNVPDPNSLIYEKWGKVGYKEKDGWLVWCQFRAKGAIDRHYKYTKWFVIRGGTVVAMKDSNAYR